MKAADNGVADTTMERRCRRRLMVVEPDRLTRWSVARFLGEVFDVVEADSSYSAIKMLDESPADAIVVADDLPEDGAGTVESCARSRNRNVQVIRTFTPPMGAGKEPAKSVWLEKPFKLSALAKLLSD